MKRSLTAYVFIICVQFIGVVFGSDDLRPSYYSSYSEEEARLLRLLASLNEDSLAVKVEREFKENSNQIPSIQAVQYENWYKVKVSSEVQGFVDKFDDDFVEYFLLPHLRTENFSYNASVLTLAYMSRGDNRRIYLMNQGCDFLNNNASVTEYAKAAPKVIEFVRNHFEEIKDERRYTARYELALLYNATPIHYREVLFPLVSERINSKETGEIKWKWKWNVGDEGESGFSLYFRNDNLAEERFLNMKYCRGSLEMWMLRLFDGFMKSRVRSVRDQEIFTKWLSSAAKGNEAEAAVLSMSLFVCDGYNYDPVTDKYKITPYGELSLRSIINHPIAENAFNLSVLINRGCGEEIKGMMNQAGTEEKWRPLLSSPTRPNYTPYLQDLISAKNVPAK